MRQYQYLNGGRYRVMIDDDLVRPIVEAKVRSRYHGVAHHWRSVPENTALRTRLIQEASDKAKDSARNLSTVETAL